MSWAALSLVTDAELGQLEPEATSSTAPWGRTTWASARAEAKRDLKIWLEVDFPNVIGVADKVVDAWAPDYLFGYTGAVYSDVTVAGEDDTESDIVLSTVLATVGSDRLYVGAAWAFDGLKVLGTGTRNANASTLTVKYSGPTAPQTWTSLTISDGTTASGGTACFARSGRITWTQPTDWQRIRLNNTGEEYFWVEVSVSATLTAGTSLTQILPIRAPDGLKRVAGYLSLAHIYNGLAAGSPGEERWRLQGEKYWEMGKSLYAALKNNANLWIDMDVSGTVSQAEVPISVPHILGRG